MKIEIAQRRRDKDLAPRTNNDKSKLRDDRKKPHGLPKSDPDSFDVKKDPDLKKGSAKFNRIAIAKSLVRMARLMIAAEMEFEKTYEVDEKNNVLTVCVSWKNCEDMFDFDDLIITGSEVATSIDEALSKNGVKRRPDNLEEKSWIPTEDDMTLKYYIPDNNQYESILRREGFKKK